MYGLTITDGLVVRAGDSGSWNVLSWSGGHEFEPQSGRTWGAWYFCRKSYLNQKYVWVNILTLSLQGTALKDLTLMSSFPPYQSDKSYPTFSSFNLPTPIYQLHQYVATVPESSYHSPHSLSFLPLFDPLPVATERMKSIPSLLYHHFFSNLPIYQSHHICRGFSQTNQQFIAPATPNV